MKDYLLNKNIGLIDLNEIELNAFEIENDIILSHLGDSDEEFDNLVCNILTLDPENNSEVKPYQHRAILVLDPKTDELMAEYRNVKEACTRVSISLHNNFIRELDRGGNIACCGYLTSYNYLCNVNLK